MQRKTRNVIIYALLFIAACSVLGAEEGYTPEKLFSSALQYNMELRKMDTEKKQAEIDRKSAEAAAFPSVDFQTTLSYQTNPMIDPITVSAGEFGAYDIAGTSLLLPMEDMVIYKGMENTWYEFKFIVDQPVFTWGKIPASIELYHGIEESSGLLKKKKENEIITQIYIYLTTLYYLEQIEESMAAQSAYADRLITIADESYKNGFILYTDLLEARIQQKELRIAEAELTEQKEEAMLGLSQLSGIKELELSDLDYGFIPDIESIELREREYYINKAINENPVIELLKLAGDINSLRIEISEASDYFKPDIGLHLELGYSGPRFPFLEADWFGQDSLGLTATLALQTTVFDGGKLKYSIERDTEELNKSMYEYEYGLDNISYFITESLLKIELNRQNIEYYSLLQENDQQQIDQQQTLFEAGSGDESLLLKKRIDKSISRIKEYKELIGFYRNYYSLMGTSTLVPEL